MERSADEWAALRFASLVPGVARRAPGPRGCRTEVPDAVRSGGHHAAGLGTWDDAPVIDLSRMCSTTRPPTARISMP
jgi:hypothetical protein